jgi:hypothetical protein
MYFEFGKRELTPTFEQLNQNTIPAKSSKKNEIFSYASLGSFLQNEGVQPTTSKNAQEPNTNTRRKFFSRTHNFSSSFTDLKTKLKKRTVDALHSTEGKINKSTKNKKVSEIKNIDF